MKKGKKIRNLKKKVIKKQFLNVLMDVKGNIRWIQLFIDVPTAEIC